MPDETVMEQSDTVGVTPLETIRSLSGFEFLRRISVGELPGPPIAALMGFRIAEVGDGQVTFTCVPEFRHYNPIGSVHGGLAGTLLDSCMACAVQSRLPAGKGYTTLEYKINLVRGLTDQTGPIRAEGTAIQVGSRIGTAEGRIVDSEGRLYAHGTTTCLIFSI